MAKLAGYLLPMANTTLRRRAFAAFLLCALMAPAQAQTFSVLHAFTGGVDDGADPSAGLTIDARGSLYGTTSMGGFSGFEGCDGGCGVVFKLSASGNAWTVTPLSGFHFYGNDPNHPMARVVFGPDSALYGTSYEGGGIGCTDDGPPLQPFGCGTLFSVKPGVGAFYRWIDLVLYSFGLPSDGGTLPGYGDVIFDQAGNIYGTTRTGGSHNNSGAVYELTPADGGWTQEVLYGFTGQNDGGSPYGGVVFDRAGNLYGTTTAGGSAGYGTVFELTYVAGSGWTENVLYSFQNGADGADPVAGLIFDQSGNLYGATSSGGTGNGGTVFELSPSGGGWTLTILYSFMGRANQTCGPWAVLAMDRSGNLLGTTRCDGANNLGSVFKLMPSNGGWTYTSLHDFTGGTDGADPISNVIFDASGNLYGTAFQGGQVGTLNCGDIGCGVVWEIAP